MNLSHISYSQYNTYNNCPRSWYLGKVRQAEEKQTWYLPIGTAVHSMIEEHLLGGESPVVSSAESFFYPLIKKQMAIEPDTSKWLAGGSWDAPVTERRALQQVKDCFENAMTFLSDMEVWEVEYDATSNLPGLDVPVKAYIDVVGEHKKHGPLIPDWKTGTSKPKTNFQLETYGALLRTDGDYKDIEFKGYWAMLKPEAKPKTEKARLVDLSHVDVSMIGSKYQETYDKMKATLYQYKHGHDCKFCFHQDNCLLQAGPTVRATFYDRADEDGIPF